MSSRVDIRGTGNSEGRLIEYEYTDQEQEDGEVIMLRPEVIRDLRLREHGLRMVPCEPALRVTGMPKDADPPRRALFTLIPSLEFAERSYHRSKLGEIPDELWLDCVVASNVDDTLAPPNRHVLTCFVQYVPYRLKDSTWDDAREGFGDRVIEIIGSYAPNVPQAVVARQVLTPLDLERIYGLTEGNIFHGDLSLEQLFFMRLVPGWSRYRSPIEGLYLCGAGAHPGGGVTGAPGYNAAHVALRNSGRA